VFTVTLADTSGDLTVATAGLAAITGDGGTLVSFSGTLAAVNAALASLSDSDAVLANDTITASASDSLGNRAVPQSIAVTVNPPQGQTFTLTRGVDTVVGGLGNNTIDAATNTLSPGDSIDGGGGGNNTLVLQGGGLFDLRAPSLLTNVQTITAQEGQAIFISGNGVIPATNQIVYLRDGLNATVDVTAASVNPNNPRPATITIFGANNSDTINLASGNDTVVLGSAAETVNGGTGNDVFEVNAATIGATIDGGTGKSSLYVTGGGTVTMGASVSHITNVILAAAPTKMAFTSNAESGLTVYDLGRLGDTVTAGGSGQTLTGGAAGLTSFNAATAGGTTFLNTAAAFSGDTIGGFAGSGNVIEISDINYGASGFGFTFTENQAGTAGTLSVTDGTHSTSVTLTGNFLSAGFSATSFGTAGTAIHYGVPVA
jgi:hypothetical protein